MKKAKKKKKNHDSVKCIWKEKSQINHDFYISSALGKEKKYKKLKKIKIKEIPRKRIIISLFKSQNLLKQESIFPFLLWSLLYICMYYI